MVRLWRSFGPRAAAALTAWALLAAPGAAYSQNSAQLGTMVLPLQTRIPGAAFIPTAEDRLLVLINAVRQSRHIAPLTMSGALRMAARYHSRDMAANGYIGHGTSTGESFLARLAQALSHGSRVGENVAAGVDVERIHAAFVHSPGHLENLLNPRFRHVGIGVATTDEFLIATEDFAE
ncbi:MAG TPA: CAP domain-containing protein [bacterium]|nr:CAP domain-containing protein [bacterium]